jgi:hypothetical protein
MRPAGRGLDVPGVEAIQQHFSALFTNSVSIEAYVMSNDKAINELRFLMDLEGADKAQSRHLLRRAE